MLFNSFDFALFLPIVFSLYWAFSRFGIRVQNVFILIASYIFYGWWDWRFLGLILISTTVDFLIGIKLKHQRSLLKRKTLLYISIILNLGLLGFFKYFDFFVESFTAAFSFFGTEISPNRLNIILPVGISFYTFQTLSYTIDVYRKKITPTSDFVVFASFVTFFPQLVAGPIERAGYLLPQFQKERKFEYQKAVDGLRQILWGFVKKIIIADNCAFFVDIIFENYEQYPGSTLVLGACFYALQLYGDFSGYSDIAIGTARLFGFSLNQNFKYPLFANNLIELWKRWHISLYSWLRDYIYIPIINYLTFSRKKKQVIGVMVVFILSGLWHGANWTLISWGFINGLLLAVSLVFGKKKMNEENNNVKFRWLMHLKEIMGMIITFSIFSLTCVFVKAIALSHAYGYLGSIFSSSLFTIPVLPAKALLLMIAPVILVFMLVEWKGRKDQYAIENLGLNWKSPVRWVMYYILIISIFYLMVEEQQEFIYFQF